MVRPGVAFSCQGDPAALPEGPAVYVIWSSGGTPHLGRTNVLRRRIQRLFTRWRLAETAERVEYWPVASRLEQWLVSYWLGRKLFPDDYERVLRLPKPPYVRLILQNDFARTQITTRLAGQHSVFFGPFPTRAVADQFESQFLDLFQLRRCQEDLVPSPDHPGCIYGEMRMCLRPCQMAVTREEYASEVARVQEFLVTRGEKMIESAAAARERSSEELDFEEAARQHARLEKIVQISRIPGDLAGDISQLHGLAVTRSTEPDSVRLWFLIEGCWLAPRDFSVAPAAAGKPVSMDARLRTLVSELENARASLALRQDHLALLVKWYFSSWRDGEWLSFESRDTVPYRKLVNAINRVAHPAP